MSKTIKNVTVLALCQGLVMTTGSILITASGLVGYALAEQKSLVILKIMP